MGLATSLLRLLGAYRLYERYLKSQISGKEPPQHVGVILDGNRRWSARRGLPRSFGYRVGAERVEELLEWCREFGVKTLTVYALSVENLQNRSREEVEELLGILEEKLRELARSEKVHRYRVRVKAIGKLQLLPESVRRAVEEVEKATENYGDLYLNIAVAYGGRAEITDMVRKVAEKVKAGLLRPEEISQKVVEEHLYTSHLPKQEPDLIIRTSGEERLSGFLLWQVAYSELVFLDVMWPDFRKIDFMRAIRVYQSRERRFGG